MATCTCGAPPDSIHEPICDLMQPRGELTGAYVQAWVWVPLLEDEEGGPEPSDDWFRTEAQAMYQHEGEVEIDAKAPVNRSYE